MRSQNPLKKLGQFLRRRLRRLKFYIKHGFSEKELWNLDYTVAVFMIPRLKAFMEDLNGYPANITFDEWKNILEDILFALEFTAQELRVRGVYLELILDDSPEAAQKLKDFEERRIRGLKYLGEYFNALWD